MEAKRLISYHPSIEDATSFWRASGPFGPLRLKGWIVEQYGVLPNWPAIGTADAVFMQRPYADEHLNVVQMSKILYRKVWIDFDDNLLEVPPSNPSFHKFRNPKVRENIAKILQLADVVTFSTKDLAAQTIAAVPGIKCPVVVPNAWNDSFFPELVKPFAMHKTFFWRGSQTHDDDVESVRSEMRKIAKKYSDWNFLFVGTPPMGIMRELDNRFIFLDKMPIMRYLSFLSQLQCAVCLVPLADSAFNRAKSNIAWQEATYAGCATVAPDFPEWRLDGVVRYGNGRSFSDAVDLAVSNAAEWHERSVKSLVEHRLLSTVNAAREGILRFLGGADAELEIKGPMRLREVKA